MSTSSQQYDEWYEQNKEGLTSLTCEAKLRKAFEAGIEASEMSRVGVNG